MSSKKNRKYKKHKNNEESYEEDLFESDETFAYIAGYTAGGAPYGITWEEWEKFENEDEMLRMKEEV